MTQHSDDPPQVARGAQRFLQALLRIVGTVALLAIPCALMPYAWMNAIHHWLGMGDLPSTAVVGYLARTASMFYALMGGLFWVISFDLRRHCNVVRYLGVALTSFGLFLLVVDLVEGLPWWWSLAEGPFNIGLGVAILAIGWNLSEQD